MVGFVSMGPSAQCWMYLQQVGSALFGDAYYSWRSAESVKDSRDYGGIRLLDAETRFRSMPELIVDLEPKFWISTETGERGGASAAATARFQQALANPQSIGIMCLGASYVVGAIVSFEMLSLAVCDPLADPSSVKQENAACARPNALQR
jgi:cephalosporin hydroxylase